MINSNLGVSEDDLANSILNLLYGEIDAKSIIVITVAGASIFISIIQYLLIGRERRQNEKITDKALLGWIKVGKHKKTYVDKLLWQYGYWAIIFLGCLTLHLIIEIYFNNLMAHIISKLAHALFSYIYGRYLWKSIKTKRYMGNITKHKIVATVSIYIVFFITFYLATIDILFKTSRIAFWIMIIAWCVFIMSDWESEYIYENKYVTVKIKEFGSLENVQAWNIKNYNGWIGLIICDNGQTQERRVKKEDIAGAIYFGNPVVVKSNVKFLNVYNRTVEDSAEEK